MSLGFFIMAKTKRRHKSTTTDISGNMDQYWILIGRMRLLSQSVE